MDKLSKKIVSMLKSNAYDSVYINTLAKLPIVVTREGAFLSNNSDVIDQNGDTYPINLDTGEEYEDGVNLVIQNILQTNSVEDRIAYLRLLSELYGDINAYSIDGDTYPIDLYSGREYIDGLHTIVHDVYETDQESDNVVFLRTLLMWWLWRKCRIANVKKFHYDDTWYSHRYSVDYPEETFGILEVANLPFRPLTKLINKKSFICRMDQLMFNGIMQPFMLFINNKFVNWNVIDVVFDCDDTYLLLHGKEYNHYNLENVKISMVILPFKTEYVGTEPDDIWNKNYDMLKGFLQDSLHINENDKIEIEVPTMYSIYKKRGMVYNVGAWMYTQVYMDYLGLLSPDRTSKLKRIILTRITYDNAGNILSKYDTKFNALDKDSYDIKTYNEICHCSLDYLKERAMFRFNDNGILDLENGNNILANLDESMTVIVEQHAESDILLNYSNFNETLFRESFIVFRCGLFDPECIIKKHSLNIFSIDNTFECPYATVMFKPAMIETMIRHSDNFINKDYFIDKILDYVKSDNKDSNIGKLLFLANENLNYLYFDNLLYEDNFNQGFKTIMHFNPLLLNDLTKTTIKSTVVSGKTANESLTFALGNENRNGLKIPRYRYKDHETYVIVFLNGELIENYSEMYAASNYFFLPVDKEFANGDVIEFLFFIYCDNNEIHFNITDNMISKLEDSKDLEFAKSELFKEYIRSEDIKIFAKYPKEIMIYQDLIEETDDIAFNISYRRSVNGSLLVFKDVIKNSSNEFTAVSSRKFIYERLYVDQKAYRIKLGQRFRYCDNQKQYILFINGRRMEDDSFFITVPKYSRPFWGIYLYTRKFVGPEDRIEIFYVPEELYNINTEELAPATFGTDGYIETEKNYLNVPYDDDFYLYFINGKKIPHSHIIPIDSHTVRVKSDTKSLLRLNINPVYRSTDSAITSYMKGNNVSKYDQLIQYIKDTFGYSELDNLFDSHIKMSDVEEDAIWRNVDRIAIINEIVRDFWVTSGYPYNEQPFIYDYALDEIIVKDRNGNYILPALDASPYINIIKNDIRLLYLNISTGTNVFEIGSTVNDFKFDWEFTNPIGYATITLVSQYINGIKLDNNIRTYTYPDSISENMSFYFQFNTMQATIDKRIDIKFCNGIYYGVVDEDLLQHYNKKINLSSNKLIAVVAKDKRIPSSAEQAIENESIDVIKKDNYVIYNLKFLKDGSTDELIDLENGEFIGIYEDGTITGDLLNSDEVLEIAEVLNDTGITLNEYYDKDDLGRLMSTLNRVYQDTPTLDFETYKIGSNNYFVYACPKRLAYDENGRSLVHFTMPDINDPDVIAYGKDDHTTPVYTNGEFDEYENTLIKLDECKMEFMDEFEYTNPSGYTETYVIWKTNGFFTRKYDDYEFKMSVKSEDDFVCAELDIEVTNNETESIRIVNTASPTGVDVNDNIVFIDTLIYKK